MIFLSGLVWLAVGCWLLPLGLNFVVSTLLDKNVNMSRPVLDGLAPYFRGVESAAMIWIAICLMIGCLKGRFIFAKTVNRGVQRISKLPNPAPLSQIYPLSYYILLGSMVFLGFLVRYAPLDVRGGVDVIIGTALINGAMLYFRQAWAARQKPAYL